MNRRLNQKSILFLLAVVAYVAYLWFMSFAFPTSTQREPVETVVPPISNPESEQPSIDSEEATDQPTTDQPTTDQPQSGTTSPTVIQRRSNFKQQQSAPTNVILLIGDGMGFEQLMAASLYTYGEGGRLFMQSAPFQSTMQTNSIDGSITDSAAAATAMATGHRVMNGVLSQGTAGQPLETSMEFFQKRCKSTGLVATSYVNHATPAAFAAHQPSRGLLEQIATDLFTRTRPNVLFGGIKDGVSPSIAEKNGYSVVTNRNQLNGLSLGVTPYVSGQFGYDNMAFEYDNHVGSSNFYHTNPHLSEMGQKAIEILSQDPDGFFLMIEGSRIDHAGHLNSLEQNIFEVLEFDRTVEAAVNWATEHKAATGAETLVIVTADHETGGLRVLQNRGARQFPKVSWSTFGHTDLPVPVFVWGSSEARSATITQNVDIYHLTVEGQGVAPASCPDEDSQFQGLGSHDASLFDNQLYLSMISGGSPGGEIALSVANSPDSWIGPGEQIVYTIDYATGPKAVQNAQIFSRLPEGVLLNEAETLAQSPNVIVAESDTQPLLTWNLGFLVAETKGSISYVVYRPSVADNVGKESIEILKLVPSEATANQPIVYSIQVTNRSDEALHDLFVADTIPVGAIYVDGAATPPEDGRVLWKIDTLEPGASHTVSYSAIVQQSVVSLGAEVYTLDGLRAISYESAVTLVEGKPLADNPDGVIIVNNSTWATWNDGGSPGNANARMVFNPNPPNQAQ